MPLFSHAAGTSDEEEAAFYGQLAGRGASQITSRLGVTNPIQRITDTGRGQFPSARPPGHNPASPADDGFPRFYPTASVTPSSDHLPPTLIPTASLSPEGMFMGNLMFTCITPETHPGAAPA
jgi:hypothetical protein